MQTFQDPPTFAASELPTTSSAPNYTYISTIVRAYTQDISLNHGIFFYSHFGSETAPVSAEIFIDSDLYSRYSAPALTERKEFRVRNLASGVEIARTLHFDTSVWAWEVVIARDTFARIPRELPVDIPEP